MNTFIDLKLAITLEIPASNDERYWLTIQEDTGQDTSEVFQKVSSYYIPVKEAPCWLFANGKGIHHSHGLSDW